MPWQQNKRTGEWREVNGPPTGQQGGVVAPNPMQQQQRQAEEARKNQAAFIDEQRLKLAQDEAARKQEEYTRTHYPDGTPRPNGGALQSIPATAATGVQGNLATLGKIRNARQSLVGNGDSIGPVKGRLPQFVTQYTDPEGIDTRAAIGNVGAYQIHDLSGAAVTMSEAPRFAPFIPSATDTPEAAEKKLAQLEALTISDLKEATSFYSPDNGYVPYNTPGLREALAPPAPPPNRQAGVTNGVDDRQGVAKGKTRFVRDADANATVFSMWQDGKSNDEIAAYAGARGYNIQFNSKTTEYARKHPGYNPFPPLGHEEEVSFRQKAAASPLGGYLGGASSALTLGLNDELYGVGAAAMGGDYTQARDQFQGLKRGVADESPIADFVGNLSGGMLLGGGGAGLASRIPGGPAMVNAVRNSPILSGTAYGSAYGAGESNQDRMGGAFGGAAGGAIGGGLGKYAVGPLATKLAQSKWGQATGGAVNAGANKLRDLLGHSAIQREALPQMTGAERTMGGNLGNVGAVRQNMSDAADLNLPYSLADADPRLRMLAGTVTRKSPEARAMAEDVFDERFIGQADRLTNAINERLAPITNIEERGKQLMQAGNTESEPFYTIANNQGGVIDDQINAFLQSDAGREASARAYKIASNEMRDPNQLGFIMNEAGEGTVANVPSFRTLDLVKRGFDDRLDEARNPITGVVNTQGNAQLGSIDNLRARFVQRMDELNPAYPEARATYQKWAEKRDALNAGKALSSPQTLPRDVTNALPRLSKNMDEARRGYATGMVDTVGQARFSGNPYEKAMGGPSAQAKLASMFPEQAPQMKRLYDLEREMNKTKYETIGGSPTAARVAADQSLMPAIAEQGGNIAGMMGGAPNAGTATRLALQGLRFGMGKRAEKKAEQLAPVLFDQNPAAMLQYLDDFVARKGTLDKHARKIKNRAGLFGAFTAAGTTRE